MQSDQSSPKSFLTCKGLARLCGLPHSTLTWWVRNGFISPDAYVSNNPLFDENALVGVLWELRARISADRFELISSRVRSLVILGKLSGRLAAQVPRNPLL
jgi:hypothetical protein